LNEIFTRRKARKGICIFILCAWGLVAGLFG
jgi:hypothetical protein